MLDFPGAFSSHGAPEHLRPKLGAVLQPLPPLGARDPLPPAYLASSTRHAEPSCGACCLSDEPHVAIFSTAGDLGNQRRVIELYRPVIVTAENGSQIESEAVRVHLAHPETEAVDY